MPLLPDPAGDVLAGRLSSLAPPPLPSAPALTAAGPASSPVSSPPVDVTDARGAVARAVMTFKRARNASLACVVATVRAPLALYCSRASSYSLHCWRNTCSAPPTTGRSSPPTPVGCRAVCPRTLCAAIAFATSCKVSLRISLSRFPAVVTNRLVWSQEFRACVPYESNYSKYMKGTRGSTRAAQLPTNNNNIIIISVTKD